nr:GH1 family beta-glucosidase [uncultured Cellulosilyticum sp.]
MSFSKDFVWGAATASYQIEGAACEDGKGLNIWDVFCKEPGKVLHMHHGDIACDHYHSMEEDVKLMASLGLKAYRFSVSWSRILPNGTGEVCQAGIDFYNHLIDTLLKYGIIPYMTIYHWDLPYALHKKGGWLNDEIVNWFAEYATIISKNFSDRVKYFITFNEPQVFVGLGYQMGEHAPGYKLGNFELLQIGHNVLKAHGAASKALRENASSPISIGMAMASSPAIPISENEADILAAYRDYGRADLSNFIFTDSYWLDPVMFGHYPDEVIKTCGHLMPKLSDVDMKLIHQPLDFVGANIYSGHYIKADENGMPQGIPQKVGVPRTAIGWEITPDALYWGAKENYARYHIPYYITENGMSAHDTISLDGKVHDPNRIDYLHRYLHGLKRAASENIPVAGYFTWSLMDNFEWAKGYTERFGLIYVDYETQKRTFKDSAYWYQSVIETNGINL